MERVENHPLFTTSVVIYTTIPHFVYLVYHLIGQKASPQQEKILLRATFHRLFFCGGEMWAERMQFPANCRGGCLHPPAGAYGMFPYVSRQGIPCPAAVGADSLSARAVFYWFCPPWLRLGRAALRRFMRVFLISATLRARVSSDFFSKDSQYTVAFRVKSLAWVLAAVKISAAR